MINCTTLAEHLLEDELFGHVRGSFTGAINDKPGRLEAGNGGTVLFDEIADLPTSLQIKFLRFVQDRCFERIGSNRTIRVDVRIIVASNRNLEAEVAAGRFREDLYYRLNVITFTLPPLRERTQDILLFADWILKQNVDCQRASRAPAVARSRRRAARLSVARKRPRASQCPEARSRPRAHRNDHSR